MKTPTRSIRFNFSDINRESISETLNALAEALAKQDLCLGDEGWHESSPINGVQFDQAFDWVQHRWGSNGGWSAQVPSYTLKHICESDLETGYCSNGAFIAACLFAGLTAHVAVGTLACTFTGPE